MMHLNIGDEKAEVWCKCTQASNRNVSFDSFQSTMMCMVVGRSASLTDALFGQSFAIIIRFDTSMITIISDPEFVWAFCDKRLPHRLWPIRLSSRSIIIVFFHSSSDPRVCSIDETEELILTEHHRLIQRLNG